MAGSLNEVNLIGNLGQDPEMRETRDGKPIANLSVATSENWVDRQSGEKREKTEWHRVVIFSEGLARVADKYLHKGSKVYLKGQLQTRKWQDKDGNDRWSTEIVLKGFQNQLVMLGDKGDRQGGEGRSSNRSSDQGRQDTRSQSQGGHDDLDDEIPF